jgi:hypothetical protein
MAKGLYGQLQGDETSVGVVTEHYSDNQVVEGREAATLRRMLSSRNWKASNEYVEKLRQQGWSVVRLQAVMSAASVGLRF